MAKHDSVIILAAGQQTRWAPQGYKQMVDIFGKTLMLSNVELVRSAFGVEPWVVINPTNPAPFGLDYRYYLPKRCEFIFDTLESTSELWKKTTYILLGDVYYTDQTFHIIQKEDKMFFSKKAEIFAMKFHAGEWNRVKDAIKKARERGGKKLWHVYRMIEGFGIDQHEFGENMYRFASHIKIQDFDIIEKYNEFLRENEND